MLIEKAKQPEEYNGNKGDYILRLKKTCSRWNRDLSYNVETAVNRDTVDHWIGEKNKDCRTRYTADTLPDHLKVACVTEIDKDEFYEDSIEYEESLDSLVSMMLGDGHSKSGQYMVTIELPGSAEVGTYTFRWIGTASDFEDEVFEKIASHYCADVVFINNMKVQIVMYTRKYPAGIFLHVERAMECNMCKDQYVPEDDEEFCSESCQLAWEAEKDNKAKGKGGSGKKGKKGPGAPPRPL